MLHFSTGIGVSEATKIDDHCLDSASELVGRTCCDLAIGGCFWGQCMLTPSSLMAYKTHQLWGVVGFCGSGLCSYLRESLRLYVRLSTVHLPFIVPRGLPNHPPVPPAAC